MTAVIRTTDWSENQDILQGIRHSVFVEEQGVPEDLEVDEKDPSALHFLATTDDGIAIATARLVHECDEIARIGRFAVLAAYRNQGFGTRLLHHMLDYARQQGYAKIVLSAQLEAISFYEKAGFEPYGEIYLDAGLEHRSMRLILQRE